MDEHLHETAEDTQSVPRPASPGQAEVRWTTVLVVLLILLVGAVVGHGLLRNADAPAGGLPCGKAAACGSCPSGSACSLNQVTPAAAPVGGTTACVVNDGPAGQSACLAAPSAGCPKQAGCPGRPSCSEPAQP